MDRSILIEMIRAKLAERGIGSADLLSMRLEDATDERLEAMYGALSIPMSERAAAATTLLLEAISDNPVESLTTMVMLLQPIVANHGVKAPALICTACALAAASVLDYEDPREPGDFCDLVAENLRQPDAVSRFEEVRASYHRAQFQREVERDLDDLDVLDDEDYPF